MAKPGQIEKHLRAYIEKNPEKNLDPSLHIPYPFGFKAREDQLKAEKARAEEADRLKSAFLANMSHEIRTPLHGIMGITSLLLESEIEARQAAGETKVGKNEELLKLIVRSGGLLLKVINDILDLSKIEANLLEIEKVPYSLTDLDQYIRSYAKAQLLDSGKRIEVKGSMATVTPATFITDPTRLQQIVSNLLGNALKFTSSPGTIEYGVTHREGKLVFFVKDSGIGIPPEKQAVVFERFRQVDASSRRAHTGTGLGLTITKRLVELLGVGSFCCWLSLVI